MNKLQDNTFANTILKVVPIIILFISVFNEFDANYFEIEYLSFNFSYILIFFCTLKNIDNFGYGLIFFAGIINDVVSGFPMGISSLCFMLLCVATSYFRSITLRPTLIRDWMFFLITISLVNSIKFMILSYIFKSSIDYKYLLVNNFTTFLLFFFFSFAFNLYFDKFFGKSDV